MRFNNMMIILAAAGAAGALMTHHAQLEHFFPLVLAGLAATGAATGAVGVGVGFNPGAGWSSGSMPTDKVSFFKDPDFKGPRRDFGAGAEQRSLSAGFLRISGKENDTYSSMIVPAGLQVWIYEHNNFQGKIAGPIGAGKYPNLGSQFDMDNRISSLKVIADTTAAAAASPYAASFYEHQGFGGRAMNLSAEGSWAKVDVDDAFSSIKVSPGFKVTFYPKRNFKGEVGVFTAGDYPFVGDYWDNKISSLKVERA